MMAKLLPALTDYSMCTFVQDHTNTLLLEKPIIELVLIS